MCPALCMCLSRQIDRGDTVVFSSYSQDEPDMKYKDDIYAFVKAADLLGKW